MTHALDIPSYYENEILKLKGDIPVEQFVLGAVIEKIATLNTADYLAKRAEAGSFDEGLNILQRASSIPPRDGDALPQ